MSLSLYLALQVCLCLTLSLLFTIIDPLLILSLLSLTISAYLSCHGGSMFSFYFVDFLVFFWLIFKCFCFVSTYRCISYSTIFSLADLLCPFFSILLCKFVFVWPSPYCFYYCCLVINVVCL